MRISTRFTFALLLSFFFIRVSFAQVTFTNNNTQLLTATHSGCPVAVVDVNGDGLDDIVRLDQGHIVYIDYQQPGKQFTHNLIGDFGGYSGWAWGMCVGDFDHNGYMDVAAGGSGSAVKILMVDATGLSGTIISIPNSNYFVQNINVMDVNNDGWEDLFCCDDDAESHIYVNDGTGNLLASNIIDFDVTNTDDSGNYGSLWTDFDNDGDVDFYIAKCRQFIQQVGDGRRIDVLFVNNGDGTYTSDAAAYGLADSAQTWTCNFADIDNDGDLDAIQTDYDVPAKLLENDGTGHMTNITSGSGFSLTLTPIESVMEDFDNDGFVDILVTGTNYQFFHNNGNHTFTQISNVFGSEKMESFAIGDLNHDGKIDVYGSYADVYTDPTNDDDVYWLNTTANANHFITFNLEGTTATPASYGARVTLYGAWGKQVREVHGGESYGTCNSANLHFGLGTATVIDSAVVWWPSGSRMVIQNPAVDQFMTVKEGGCVSPDFTVVADGPLVFCPGQSVTTLEASALPAGYTYLWSDGSTSQNINPSVTGVYYCTAVSSGNTCSTTSVPVAITVNPAAIPTVTASGDLTFCQGGSVTLTSSAAASYLWSTGETTQSITVSDAGIFSVTVPGMCQSWSSDTLTVNMLASPAPTTTDATIGAPGYATLTATGTDISWYDVLMGGSPIATGNSFTTYADSSETFYAEDAQTYADPSVNGGELTHSGFSSYSGNSTNNYLIFDVLKSCVLQTVKVYTDSPGEREVTLRDKNGNLLQSLLVNIPADSSTITLNFSLSPDVNYQLGTDTGQNQITFGYNSPRLQRSSGGVDYPYVISDLININTSEAGDDYYYYFYNWQVAPAPTVCVSARTPANIYLVTGTPALSDVSFKLYPNPSDGLLNVQCNQQLSGHVMITVTDIAGKVITETEKSDLLPGEAIALNLSTLPKGIYLLDIASGGNTTQQKVVIE